MPEPQKCAVISEQLLTTSKPRDTSGGAFKTPIDVTKQDAAAAAHYPVLESDFNKLAKTVREAEAVNAENNADLKAAIAEMKAVFDKVIIEGTEGSKWNPFD